MQLHQEFCVSQTSGYLSRTIEPVSYFFASSEEAAKEAPPGVVVIIETDLVALAQMNKHQACEWFEQKQAEIRRKNAPKTVRLAVNLAGKPGANHRERA